MKSIDCLRGRAHSERGQTLTEYTMILGILTSILIAVLGILMPVISFVVVRLVRSMAVYLSSVQP